MLTNPALVTVQTPVVFVLNVTPNDEDAVPVTVKSGVIGFLSLNGAKEIVCNRREMNVRVTDAAAEYCVPALAPPACAAVIEHVPYDTMVTDPSGVTVQTPSELDVYVTANPEPAVAPSEKTAASSLTGLGAVNVIVCGVRTVND